MSTGNRKILIMDDEEIIRDVAGEMLRHFGYEVEFAEDGTEALEKYANAMKSGISFDAVIMDLTIPGGMGGKETVIKLIEIDPDVKAIISSGYSNDPVMSNFREYGFAGIVMKPYQISELSEQVRNVLQG
jgi:two-component system cell cycle sensor histidine kinase/response regulator CckA